MRGIRKRVQMSLLVLVMVGVGNGCDSVLTCNCGIVGIGNGITISSITNVIVFLACTYALTDSPQMCMLTIHV